MELYEPLKMKIQMRKTNNFSGTILLLNLVIMMNMTDLQPAVAQDSDYETEQDSTSFFVQDAKHFLEVGFGLLISPFYFDNGDWTKTGSAIAGTALLFTVDKNIKPFALRNQNKLNDNIFNLDSYYGNEYSVILAWGIYGYGALTDNNRVRKVGLNAVEAFIYSGAITGALKLIIGRRRPYAGDDHLFWRPFQFTNTDYQSLPSGHTTVSFAVSTVLAKSVDNSLWKTFWYGTAGLVGASRIYHNKHWLSDVFLGGVIGYIVGDFVIGFDRNEQPRLFGKRIQPYLGPGMIGLLVYTN